MKITFARSAFPVAGLGPGERVVVWVSGCSLRCEGCMTPELFARGEMREVNDVADELAPTLAICPRLTISGGEPFEQAAAVAEFVRALRTQRDLEVLIYSGYRLEELCMRGSAANDLLLLTDILIDGRFVERERNTLQWRGSDNQRVHLLSPRAQRYAGAADQAMEEARTIRYIVAAGALTIVGLPRRGDLETFKSMLRAYGAVREAS